MCFRIIILLLAGMPLSGIKAQGPALYFTRLNTENGLSHNQVNCMLQDKRGFMWFGTEDGLNRFDGKHFTVFRNNPNDTSSLSGNIVTGLLEDENGILWITTANGGLSRYDYRQSPERQFRQYRHNPADSRSIPLNTLYALVEDSSGYLWLASAGKSVLRFDRQKEIFEEVVTEGTRTALSLCFDPEGELWVGRQGGGLLRVNTNTLQYSMDARYRDLYANLPHAAITAIYRDRNNNMWFGSWDNVLYRHTAGSKEEMVFRGGASGPAGVTGYNNDEATAFAEDRNGRLWVGGKRAGLQVYDSKRGVFYKYVHTPALEGSVSSNRILALCCDREGRMWVGTDKGISLFDPGRLAFNQEFLYKVSDPRNGQLRIYDIYEAENGDWLLGTSQGLFFKKTGTSAFIHQPLRYQGQPLTVTSFLPGEKDYLYLGTDYTLFRYYPGRQKLEALENSQADKVMSKIIDSRIVSIVRDTIAGHPVLLVSPYGHYLAYYDLYDKKWVSRLDSQVRPVESFNLADNLVPRLYRSPAGELWMATVRNGIGRWRKGNPYPAVSYFQNQPQQPGSLGENHVYDMVGNRAGDLWVSTYGAGLYLFKIAKGTFQHIAEAPNLLEGIALDDQERVWMLGHGQLHCYDPGKRSFHSFDLPDIEKSGGAGGYLHRLRSGQMLLAGAGYVIVFHPDSVNMAKPGQPVYFTDFRIFSESRNQLLQSGKVKLQPGQNYFTLEFASPDFASPGVTYAYQLKGWDKDWVEAGSNHSAQYSNIPGGNYEFRVRVTNRPGGPTASIPITIVPPVTQRWWFFAIAGFLLAMLIFGAYRYRIKELLERQAIRNKIAQDLHDNVGSTLSSISVYSQVAKIYREKNRQDDLQHALDKISSISSEMISEMNDIVWAINPRNDNMATIVQRMESYAKPLLSAREIAFHFKVEPSVKEFYLEMTRRKNFYLIFKEAINNAVKYSSCRNITVHITSDHQHMILDVKDDGKGFDRQNTHSRNQSLSGNGLANMQMRAEEMKGECLIESQPGAGTHIRLSFRVT